jgi:hypothetical protein
MADPVKSAILQVLKGDTKKSQDIKGFYEITKYSRNPATYAGANKGFAFADNDIDWSDEDLRFIIDNLKNAPASNRQQYAKYFFGADIQNLKQRPQGSFESLIRKYPVYAGVSLAIAATGVDNVQTGLIEQIKRVVKSNTPGDPLLLEATVEVLRHTDVKNKDALRALGDYFLLNQTALLQLVSMQDFVFNEFDLLVTKKMNEHLETNPQVPNLVLAGKTFTGSAYAWPEEGKEEIPVAVYEAANIEKSLVELQSALYKFPFTSDSIKSQENTVRLSPDKGFSAFKAGELDAQKAFPQAILEQMYNNVFGTTQPATALSSTIGQWAFFVIGMLDLLDDKGPDGKYTPDYNLVKQLFDKEATNLLTTRISVPVPVTGQVTFNQVRMTIQGYVAKKILDVFRYTAWKVFAKDLQGKTEEQAKEYAKNAAENIKKAFEQAEAAAAASEAAVGGQPRQTGEVLSQAEIEQRQRFLKQCALMTRLPTLQKEHLKTAAKSNLYQGRFYMVKDGNADQSGIMTKILMPKGSSIKEFLDMTPAVHAHLTPKLRFFKVFDGSNGPSQTEFKFRKFTSRKRVDDLKNSQYDKGGDYGIKEFSFSFQGTTPATAKNDIKASLSLYFQSFQDFIDEGFVDLLLLPSKNSAELQESKFHYSPRYYRIRADVGWTIDSINVKDLQTSLGTKRFKELKNALIKTNKSFYLNMVDHTLDFKDDGSVQIDVEYRAYIETSTKDPKLDALASPQIIKDREKIKEDYRNVLASNKCTVQELAMVKAQLDQISQLAIKNSFQSIMNRLIANDAMYFKILNPTAENRFQRNGFFTAPVKFITEVEPSEPTEEKKEKSKKKKKPTARIKSDSFTDLRNDKDYLYVNYFFLGDLLYVILDTMYEGKNYRSGYENFKFLLGSFEYEDPFTGNNHVINLAQIPISAELFFEWFTENVLKPERQSYPIMYFIRDLCNYLIGEILTENCFKRSLDKSMQFKTTNFVGIGNPFKDIKDTIKDLNKYYGSKFPMPQDSEKEVSIGSFTNYVMIYVDSPKLKVRQDNNYKRGVKSSDQNIGIYHYQIGKPYGLLKKMKFSKTDMQYIREARFFRNGYDGLMQLAAVYKVNLDMIGNTLYYPGMEIYVNPLGFMGASNNAYNPTIGGANASIANKLGFGGYHLVTSVKSTIAPGKFTTQVEAMFNYSGDGDPSSTVIGSREAEKKKEKINQRSNAFPKGGACTPIYNQVIGRALDVKKGGKYTSINTNPAPATTTSDGGS